MKTFICALWLVLCTNAPSQETITHNISDDGFVEVPLQFVFPYYGQLFTNSWMFDNGVVGFYSPFNGYTGGQNYFSQPFSSSIGSQFNYMIAPLWTDLINYNGSFTTQGDSTFQRYNWNNISQWGYPNNLNSFSLEITPSGSINVQYDQINISGYPVSVGTTGDLSQGEFEQIFYASSGEQVTTNSIADWSTYTEADTCGMDPLSSPQCPGYDTAYYEQQCSFDPLYDSQCPGYDTAYYEQQCSADPLYDSQCPGYEIAYYDQQCSADPLYDNQCPGYEIAYYDQQCSVDPLYDNQCPGYEMAYYDQQCSIDALYDNQCPSYEMAYYDQQCSIDPLYDNQCPGYEIAYYDQQCSIDALYDNQCPGYEIAYILSQQNSMLTADTNDSSSVPETEAVVVESESFQESETELAETTITEVIIAEVSAELVDESLTDSDAESESTTETSISANLLSRILTAIQSQANTTPVSITTNTAASTTDNISVTGTSDIANLDSTDALSVESDFAESDLSSDDVADGQNQENIALLTELIENLFVSNTNLSATSESENSQITAITDQIADLDQEYLSELTTTLQETLTTFITANTTAAFGNDSMQQVLALGGTITQILNTPVPDFSRFEIKPPSQEEQVVASRIENSLGNMSEEEIENQAESRIGSMDPAAQAIALQLIGYKPGFDQYGGNIVDQNNWYTDRGVYTNNRVPTSARSNLMFGAQDQRHQELMSLQYGR